MLRSRFLHSCNCLFSIFLESKKFTFILITFYQNELESCATSQIVGNWNAFPNLSNFFRWRFGQDITPKSWCVFIFLVRIRITENVLDAPTIHFSKPSGSWSPDAPCGSPITVFHNHYCRWQLGFGISSFTKKCLFNLFLWFFFSSLKILSSQDIHLRWNGKIYYGSKNNKQ